MDMHIITQQGGAIITKELFTKPADGEKFMVVTSACGGREEAFVGEYGSRARAVEVIKDIATMTQEHIVFATFCGEATVNQIRSPVWAYAPEE